jgi:hypothetical protein
MLNDKFRISNGEVKRIQKTRSHFDIRTSAFEIQHSFLFLLCVFVPLRLLLVLTVIFGQTGNLTEPAASK